MLQQRSARLGRRDAGPSAHQQGSAEGLLHLADAGRGRGESQIRALRTMGDAARLDDVAEQIEVREIEAHGQLPSYSAKADYTKSILQRANFRFKLRK